MSCESRWHSQQNTFRQDVESIPISGGVGGTRKAGGDGGAGWDTDDTVDGVAGVGIDSEENGSRGL